MSLLWFNQNQNICIHEAYLEFPLQYSIINLNISKYVNIIKQLQNNLNKKKHIYIKATLIMGIKIIASTTVCVYYFESHPNPVQNVQCTL